MNPWLELCGCLWGLAICGELLRRNRRRSLTEAERDAEDAANDFSEDGGNHW